MKMIVLFNNREDMARAISQTVLPFTSGMDTVGIIPSINDPVLEVCPEWATVPGEALKLSEDWEDAYRAWKVKETR